VTIRVPVAWSPYETVDQRRSKALRGAREIIDHACRASGTDPQETEAADTTAAAVIERFTPRVLEGVTQELGLSEPSAGPKQKKRP
jgi:hypothetical protein